MMKGDLELMGLKKKKTDEEAKKASLIKDINKALRLVETKLALVSRTRIVINVGFIFLFGYFNKAACSKGIKF
jgi:hypothetical protein